MMMFKGKGPVVEDFREDRSMMITALEIFLTQQHLEDFHNDNMQQHLEEEDRRRKEPERL